MERKGNTLVASFSVNGGRSAYVSNEQNRLGGSRLNSETLGVFKRLGTSGQSKTIVRR